MDDIFKRVNKKYHYRLKYIIALCIAIASTIFMGMIVISVLFLNTDIVVEDEGIGFLILILILALYLRWFCKNWRSSNRSICQYYDIDPQQIKQMIEKETFYDCVKEKIPNYLYQESQNYYMMCGKFIAKESVLSVQFGTVGGAGGKGQEANIYKFILCNGTRVSVKTPYRIMLLGKVSPNFYDDSVKRGYWSTFAGTRRSWIRSFYKQWVSEGNQPISLLTDEASVDEYKKQLMKYIIGKKRGRIEDGY
ncbi:hypothetical protein [Anaerosporobacter sp.]